MHRYSMFLNVLILLCAFIFSTAAAAQGVSENNEIQELKKQLEALKAAHELKLTELEALITQIKEEIARKEQEEELQKLLREATQLTTVGRLFWRGQHIG